VPAAAQRQDVRPLHDMTTPFTFQGRLTLEDVLDIQHYRWRVALRPAVRVLIALVAIPIALLSVENVYRYGLVPRNSFGMAPLSFFLLSCYAAGGWSVLNRATARRFYQQNPDRYLETQIVLDDTTLAFRNATVESRLAWSVIPLVVDTPKGVLFLAPHFRQLLWLPRRVFDDSQPKSRVLDLVAKNGVRVCTAA